jgi:hypothetical protein
MPPSEEERSLLVSVVISINLSIHGGSLPGRNLQLIGYERGWEGRGNEIGR